MAFEGLDGDTFTTHSLKETDLFVSRLVKKIEPNLTIFLNGEIGAGKTYLCSRTASHFGVGNLTSSSFGRVSMHAGDVNVVHCDFYRSKLNYEFFSLEVEPLLKAPWLLLVEWSKNEEQAIDTGKTMRIEIIHKGANSREIRLSGIN